MSMYRRTERALMPTRPARATSGAPPLDHLAPITSGNHRFGGMGGEAPIARLAQRPGRRR
jgi:hypothetical protein